MFACSIDHFAQTPEQGGYNLMSTVNVSQKTATSRYRALLSLFFSLLLFLSISCANDSSANIPAPTVSNNASTTSSQTETGMDDEVAATIQTGTKPKIVVKGENAALLTFVGTDTQSISSGTLALPYKKEGNTVTIDFGKTITQELEIKIPHQASLSVVLANGNVVIETIQGQVGVTLTSGTIRVKNFTPGGTNTIATKNGTIDVTFATKASCSLKARTDFGAITSGYSAIHEQRNASRSEASGKIGNDSETTVNLTAGYGSITIGPV
jgi:hypothetical protein